MVPPHVASLLLERGRRLSLPRLVPRLRSADPAEGRDPHHQPDHLREPAAAAGHREHDVRGLPQRRRGRLPGGPARQGGGALGAGRGTHAEGPVSLRVIPGDPCPVWRPMGASSRLVW